VIRACGCPLAAPSANPSSQLSPTTAEHVRKHLGDKIRLIVDGGQSQLGIESTVLDLTVAPPRLLRPGMIHEQTLRAVIGEVRSAKCEVRIGGTVLRSPGALRKHYAPRAKLAVLDWRDEADLRAQIAKRKAQIAKCHVIAYSRILPGAGFGGVSVFPRDAAAFARAIYAELHRCDEAGAALILVEALPETSEWRAIADRLARAAA